MFKFLRKYNKMLLAVFGVALMITFLIPQAFDTFSERAAARTGTIATVGEGEDVSSALWSRYQAEIQVLDALRRTGMLPPLPGLGYVERPEHWFLLVREAEAAGLVPVVELRDASDEMMQAWMSMTGERDIETIGRALAHQAGVGQMLHLYATGDLFSDRRMQVEAERLLHALSARMVVLSADPEKSDFEPTQQQIEEQFEKYADVMPGVGERGLGYRLPDRVKLEWLTIPAASIGAVTEKSEAMDRVQQFRHWKRNPNGKAEFPPYPTEAGASDIPAVVRDDLLETLTREKTEEIAKFTADTLRLARRGLSEHDGYVVLPDDWTQRQRGFTQLAEELQRRFGVDLPTYEARGEQWIALDQLATLPGIGAASTDRFGSAPISLTELVRAAKELGGNPTINIQKSVAGPPLRDAGGNLYFFRITDASPSHRPANVDEVRSQIVADLKRQHEYQRLKESLTSLEDQARREGLLALALAEQTVVHPVTPVYLWNEFYIQNLQQFVQMGLPLMARPSPLPEIGEDRATVETIIDRAMELPSTTPAAQLPVEQRIFGVGADDKFAVLVLEVVSQSPLTRETYDRLADTGMLQRLISEEEGDEGRDIEKAFSFETLARRNKFAFTRERGDAEGDADGDANGDEPARAASAAG